MLIGLVLFRGAWVEGKAYRHMVVDGGNTDSEDTAAQQEANEVRRLVIAWLVTKQITTQSGLTASTVS